MIFDRFIKKNKTDDSMLMPEIDETLDESKIVVELQPVIRPGDNKLVAAEALSRYLGADNSMIAPMLFIPIFESASVISQLDEAVVHHVGDCMQQWKERGYDLPRISFNFAGADFAKENFLEDIDAYFTGHNIDRDSVVIEVRESAVADSYEFMKKRLDWLHGLGYHIAIDDFGREENLIFSFGDLPVDVIKFDCAVLMDAMYNTKGRIIIKHLISGLKEAGMSVVCEGVETKEELEWVMDAGCETVQGFLYDRPLSMESFLKKYLS